MSWDRSVNHVAGPDKPDRHSAADFGSTNQGRRQSRRRPAGGAVLGPPLNLTPVAGLTRLRDAARAPQPHPVYRSWITSESWACRVSPRRSISTNAPACASPGSKARPNDVTVTANVCDFDRHLWFRRSVAGCRRYDGQERDRAGDKADRRSESTTVAHVSPLARLVGPVLRLRLEPVTGRDFGRVPESSAPAHGR